MASSLGAASLGRGLQCHPTRLQPPTAVLQQASRCSISRASSSILPSTVLRIQPCRQCSSRVQAAADVAAAADQQQQAEPQAKQQKQQKQQGKKQQQQQKQGGGEYLQAMITTVGDTPQHHQNLPAYWLIFSRCVEQSPTWALASVSPVSAGLHAHHNWTTITHSHAASHSFMFACHP